MKLGIKEQVQSYPDIQLYIRSKGSKKPSRNAPITAWEKYYVAETAGSMLLIQQLQQNKEKMDLLVPKNLPPDYFLPIIGQELPTAEPVVIPNFGNAQVRHGIVSEQTSTHHLPKQTEGNVNTRPTQPNFPPSSASENDQENSPRHDSPSQQPESRNSTMPEQIPRYDNISSSQIFVPIGEKTSVIPGQCTSCKEGLFPTIALTKCDHYTLSCAACLWVTSRITSSSKLYRNSRSPEGLAVPLAIV